MIDDFVDDNIAIRVAGSHGEDVIEVVRRSNIMGSFKFLPIGAREVQDKYLKGQQMITMLNNPALLPYHDVPVVLREYYDIIGITGSKRFVNDPRVMHRMPSVEFQWSTFMLGYPVPVTGKESIEEHQEAIKMNGETFLGNMLPELARVKGLSEEEIEVIVGNVKRNISEHQWFLQQKQAEQERIQQMALAEEAKRRGNGPSMEPSADTRQVQAASGQFPGPLPSATGA